MRSRGVKGFRVTGSWLIAVVMLIVLSPSGPALGAFPDFGRESPPSFADLADRVDEAIVNIFTTRTIKGGPHPFLGPDSPFRDFFGDELFRHFFGDTPDGGAMKSQALGSGVIISREGLILTNNHVVEKADEINVRTTLGKEYTAKVVGRDPKTDLALIQVEPGGGFPQPAQLGDSDAIRVGDWVIAVGNPFGLGNTVTSGIISAKGRVIGAGPYDDFLQTDAAINPGNSGGPLFNMNGEVVGINTAIVAQGQGIGFAIPINLVKQLLPQLKTGKVVRGWLGVAIQDVTPEIAQALGLDVQKGVLIADVVEGGPAEQAGLQRGDVVTEVAGKQVDTAHSLSSMVAGIRPGEQVKVRVLRDGDSRTLTVTIGTMPEERGRLSGERREPARWGVSVSNLTPDIARQFGYRRGERGVVVTDVEQGSPAGESGLRQGDLIKEAGRTKVNDVSDFRRVAEQEKDRLLLLVKRGENTFYVVLRKRAVE